MKETNASVLKAIRPACILLLLVLATACGSEAPQGVLIEGEIKGLGNDTIFLYGADRLHDRTDTIAVEQDKFAVSLPLDTLVAAWLRSPGGADYPLFMQRGDRLRVTGEAAAWDSLTVTGSLPNEELNAWHQSLRARRIMDQAVIRAQADSFICGHPASLVSIYLLEKHFVQQPQPDFRRIGTLIDGMRGELKDRPYVAELLELTKNAGKMDMGKIAPAFRMTNTKGEPVYRTSFKDQRLLIHFWASWDSLSRKDNAIYRRIHRQLKKRKKKDKDFALLGVSLDIDRKAWLDAVEQDTLEWEQVCDFNGWNGAGIVSQYAVRRLPANVLLAPNGRVEGIDMDEEELLEKLQVDKGTSQQGDKSSSSTRQLTTLSTDKGTSPPRQLVN